MARFSTPLRRTLAVSAAVVIGMSGFGIGALPATASPVPIPAEKSLPKASADNKVKIGSVESGEAYDKFIVTYKAGEPKPDISRAANDSGPAAWANRPPDQLNVKKPAKRKAKGATK